MATTYYNEKNSTKNDYRYNAIPRVVFSWRAWCLSHMFTQLHHHEISWFGRVILKDDQENPGKKVVYVDDVWLFEQECGPGETEISGADLGKFITTAPPEDMNRIRFWGHSHVNMGVFWSGTDDNAMNQLRGGGINVFVVFNKKGLYRARVDVCDGISNFWVDNIDVEFETPELPSKIDTYVAEYVERFKLDDETVRMLLSNFTRREGNNLTQELKVTDFATISPDLLEYAKTEIAAKVRARSYATKYYGGSTQRYQSASIHSTDRRIDKVVVLYTGAPITLVEKAFGPIADVGEYNRADIADALVYLDKFGLYSLNEYEVEMLNAYFGSVGRKLLPAPYNSDSYSKRRTNNRKKGDVLF